MDVPQNIGKDYLNLAKCKKCTRNLERILADKIYRNINNQSYRKNQ